MPNPSIGQHAAGGHTTDQPAVPEPSYAERARTLVHLGRLGSLSSLSRKRPGWPFGSIMPYALDPSGRPLFLISAMAMHTQNILADPRASLLVTQAEAAADPLGAGRVTLMGKVATIPEPELQPARELYLAGYEDARYWADFDDFAFYRMEIVDVYFVGGFGVMGWVTADDYLQAEVDPLAGAAAGILQHMNADHGEALVLLARKFVEREAEEASITSVDRLGFHLRIKIGERTRGARIPFSREVRTAQDARAVFVDMVREARR